MGPRRLRVPTAARCAPTAVGVVRAAPSALCLRREQNNSYTFSASFEQYNGSTGTTTPKSWSSAGQEFYAYGVCYQFYDCDDQSDVYWQTGIAKGQGAASSAVLPGSPILTATQGGNSQLFYWTLDRYQDPSVSQCDQCDVCPTCSENPNSTDVPVNTLYWYFDYSCTVADN